jgi:hypothetical protein
MVSSMMRDIKVSKDNTVVTASLQWTETPPWHVALSIPGALAAESASYDLFQCLLEIRERISADGWKICVAGARRDAWPSGMSSDMGGAWLIYVHTLGRQAGEHDLRPIFDDAPCDKVGSRAEQQEFMEKWRASLRR